MIMSESHDPLANTMINLLLQRIDGLRKLVEAFPVNCGTVLYFGDTLVDGLDDITCTFCYHVGDMCVALEGNYIPSHGLEEIFDHLSSAMVILPNIG